MSSEKRKPYPFDTIEPRWQRRWAEEGTFRAPNPGDPDFDPARPKFYVLDMFPYPSGSGLHVGHPEGYTATDIIARYKLMRGFNVLHPMGWDAFGLPAEQYAIKTGQHPRVTTEANVAHFKDQLTRLGFNYDWNREVNTTDPGYFRWTQWIFRLIYNSWFNPATNRAEEISTYTGNDPDSVRLAYVAEAPVNWCPGLGTVLANEEVVDGKSEVGGFPVERRPMRQWMLRITAFAERLIHELDGLDWPEGIKLLQKNWIGRSEGALVRFPVAGAESQTIDVFTTRPDTLFGATYMVLAPEHSLVDQIAIPACREAIAKYRSEVARKSDLERTELSKEKSGVFTGAYAVNPTNEARIPVWIADYVLAGYGTGAIMAVPAHDDRDWEFARKFSLPIQHVVKPVQGEVNEAICFLEEGVAVNSGLLDKLPTVQAKARIIDWLEAHGRGQRRINFKLRDWLFSRQRYWGEPFPVIWRNGKHESLPESELPLVPPDLEDFKPTGTGEPPLAKATDWVRYSENATRELNTMPQWAGSCWYYLRYCDPHNSKRFTGENAEQYWMGGGKPGGVDLYVGGTEHAVLHLLYARFWHKVLFDRGLVSTPEPFQRLVNQGLILGEMQFTVFRRENRNLVSLKDITAIEEEAADNGKRLIGKFLPGSGLPTEKVTGELVQAEMVQPHPNGFYLKDKPNIYVDARTFKMSKSRGNVINPEEVVADYGADSLRLFEMFMGPLEQTKPWSMTGVQGVHRFLARVWRLFMTEDQEGHWTLSEAVQDIAPTPAQLRVVHGAIKKVGADIETLSFNTAISEMMKFVNEFTTAPARPVSALRVLLQLLNPFAPHVTEELNAILETRFPTGDVGGLLARRGWPEHEERYLVETDVEIPVQVNGKVRDRIVVPKDAPAADIEATALGSAKVQEFIAGKPVRKLIVLPGKLVNIVV